MKTILAFLRGAVFLLFIAPAIGLCCVASGLSWLWFGRARADAGLVALCSVFAAWLLILSALVVAAHLT